MAIPPDIFSGQEFVLNDILPEEVVDITFEISDEECDLGFEIPRIEIFEEPVELSSMDSPEEHLWFHTVTGLRNAASILWKSGITAHQDRKYDGHEIVERTFSAKSAPHIERI